METFSADSMTVTFQGFNTHPGYAKGKLVSAIKIAADFIHRLPADSLSPETTEGYEGYVHPYVLQGGTDRASVKFLIRDFRTPRLKEMEQLVEKLARETVENYPKASVDVQIEEQYRNMREILDGQGGDPSRGSRGPHAPHPRRDRRLAAVLHEAADAQPFRGRAQLPLTTGVGLDLRHAQGGRGHGERVPHLGGESLSGVKPRRAGRARWPFRDAR
jgi:metal-dependent amidase/aminoacylase/carboxypeptidase family protein